MTKHHTTDTKFNPTCEALKDFGTSIFTEIAALVKQTDALNLAQGFPDYDGPMCLKEHAANEIIKGGNQYAPTIGVFSLRHAVARKMAHFFNVNVNPDTEVTVTAGATEGLAASLLGIINPGDEVILIEPFYDLYPAMVSRAGGVAKYVSLEQPDFHLPFDKLEAAFSSKTKAVLLNNPQNPCGKVFSKPTLEHLGALCQKYDAYVIADEVYEHMVYDNAKHITALEIETLKDRAIVVSSTAKTFSMTGWKVGFTVAPAPLTHAVRAAHQFITYTTPAPFQEAMAKGIAMDDSYYTELIIDYTHKRDLLLSGLLEAGFTAYKPQGTYFISVNIENQPFQDDMAFCRHLAKTAGVAAIPASYFWHNRRGGKDLVRFCFCKNNETLEQAIEKLLVWRNNQ